MTDRTGVDEPTSGPITVLVADDHAPTRRAVIEALSQDGFDVCAEAPDGRGAVALAKDTQPDVCVLDISMPRGGGIEAARQITGALPNTRVVMLTVSRDDVSLFEALRAGASGYLLKGMDQQRLPSALRSVLSGEAALPGSLVARLIEEFRNRDRRVIKLGSGRTARLTEKEWEVLELLRDGLSTRQVAQRLVVEPVTVRSHVASIMRKLRVSSRADAIRLSFTGP